MEPPVGMDGGAIRWNLVAQRPRGRVPASPWYVNGHTRFERWFERCMTGAGRALFAKADIPVRSFPSLPAVPNLSSPQAGSTILTMPRATLLHPRNIERVDNEAREAGTPNPITIHASILPHSSPLKRDKHQLQGQQSRLTTTQTLSLYLALNRHSSPERGNSRYSPWADYIATLPKSFRPWHPHTWLVRPIPGVPGDEDWSSLNDLAKNHLPDSTYDKLQDMLGRYRGDLKTMERCVNLAIEKEGEGSFGWRWSDLSEEDLLWGWLNGPSFPCATAAPPWLNYDYS